MEAADLVLIKSDLRDVVTAIDLSKATYSRIKWNFGWAFGYNVMGIPIAAGLFYPLVRVTLPPAVAGLAMALSSVSVVTSSILLRRYKKPTYPGLELVDDDGGVEAGHAAAGTAWNASASGTASSGGASSSWDW